MTITPIRDTYNGESPELRQIRRIGACRTGAVDMDAEFLITPLPMQERICALCPIQEVCLNFALREDPSGEWSDVWGGLTPSQRRAIKFKRERVHCPGCGSDGVIQLDSNEICMSCGVSWRY